MTYDLDAVAAAVRAVAPEITVEAEEQFLRFTDDQRTMGLLWTTNLPFDLYRCSLSKRGRCVLRVVIDELDRQDAAAEETTRP